MTDEDPNWTLDEARSWLREHLDDGASCPCCTQMAKVYKRKVGSEGARALIKLYRACGTDQYGHLLKVSNARGGDCAKLVYWELIEEERTRRADGGRAGWWRVTERGERWLRGEIRIPKHARLYDGRCLGFTGDLVSIADALGTKFDLRELMAGI